MANLFCDTTYYAEGGDILDITTEDFEISFWAKLDGRPSTTATVIAKGAHGAIPSWQIYFASNGNVYLRARDAFNQILFFCDADPFLDGDWHHYYFFSDRSDGSSCLIYIDGQSQSVTPSGTFPTTSLDNTRNIMIGASYGSAYIYQDHVTDVKLKVGGTPNTESQIIHQAGNPYDYGSNAWTLDGTREAWALDEGAGTTCAAQITSPANDLTLTNALAWDSDTPGASSSSSSSNSSSESSSSSVSVSSCSSSQSSCSSSESSCSSSSQSSCSSSQSSSSSSSQSPSSSSSSSSSSSTTAEQDLEGVFDQPANVNLMLPKTNGKVFRIQVVDINGNPVNLYDAHIRFTVKKYGTLPDPGEFQLSSSNAAQIYIYDPTAGKAIIYVESSHTEDMEIRTYIYDVQVIKGSDDPRTVLYGNITIVEVATLTLI